MNSYTNEEENIIKKATEILKSKFSRVGAAMEGTTFCKDYLILKLSDSDVENFHCLFLDTAHRVISFEKLSSGTINRATVYPREILKRAFKNNASAIILAHNHMSSPIKASDDDIKLTKLLVENFKIFDVKILDHIIVGEGEAMSFVDSGLL